MGSTWVQEGWHLRVAVTQPGMQQTNVCVNPAAVWIPLSPQRCQARGLWGRYEQRDGEGKVGKPGHMGRWGQDLLEENREVCGGH